MIIEKRDGRFVPFDRDRISHAIEQAWRAHIRIPFPDPITYAQQVTISQITDRVLARLVETFSPNDVVHVERVQDEVERQLMQAGEFDVARRYIIYRDARARQRNTLHVIDAGVGISLNQIIIEGWLTEAGLETHKGLIEEILQNLPMTPTLEQVFEAMILVCRSRIELDPAFSCHTAKLLLRKLYYEVTDHNLYKGTWDSYRAIFPSLIATGVTHERYDARLLGLDIDYLSQHLEPERDELFQYLGLQTLYDRYLMHVNGKRIELPQMFWMRVAMGLSLLEDGDHEEWAIRYYDAMSQFHYSPSTPTLFNAGTVIPQLSSCYLTTIPDDLHGIFKGYADNAQLQKWSGGVGNDWTSIRAMGSHIKGTNGQSQGLIPFLKIANDTALAVNQGGRRKGAVCAYLEPWHADIEEFLDLRKNTGDDRRRTHDMHTALWIPDLFFERVMAGETWTLFSPDQVPDLHDAYEETFQRLYEGYERAGLGRRVPAVELWRAILTSLYETGHPWITFKDASNLRNPQAHAGVIHGSNLCCVAGENLVATDLGFMTVKEYYDQQEPRIVTGSSGRTSASQMHRPLEMSSLVTVITEEGYTQTVTFDHKIPVKGRGLVEAQHLTAGDKLQLPSEEGVWGPVHAPQKALLAGIWTGDGTELKHSLCLDIWEDKTLHLAPVIEQAVATVIAEEAMRTTSTSTPKFNYSQQNTIVKARLTSAPLKRVLDVTKHKVPSFVWQGDRETVANYLAGILVTDGTFLKGVSSVQLGSTSEHWLKDLQILLANFGIRCAVRLAHPARTSSLPNGKGGYQDYDTEALWRLLISGTEHLRQLESVTQAAALRNDQAYLQSLRREAYRPNVYATFSHHEDAIDGPAYCPTVDSDDHLWSINGMLTKNTEITLNTSAEEIAVCNLASINLPQHVRDGNLDVAMLRHTIFTAMRGLDNVIDLNYYPVPEAANSNLKHRPVGLGIMGWQDLLHQLRIPFASHEAVELSDEIMERISYYAIEASIDLAEQRGAYPSYEGSTWSQGKMPFDTMKITPEQRITWLPLYERLRQHGIRNSNLLAIAPTATIANIQGVSQSIEPNYANLYAKSNLSGEFTVINPYLVERLQALNLWDQQMVDDLKYYDGSVQEIARVPDDIKEEFATAFEIHWTWLIDAAAKRQQWIDQAQSLNLFVTNPDGKELSNMYLYAWAEGLKTTYYLRTKAATQAEKSTLDINVRGLQPRWMKSQSASAGITVDRSEEFMCEVCQ